MQRLHPRITQGLIEPLTNTVACTGADIRRCRSLGTHRATFLAQRGTQGDLQDARVRRVAHTEIGAALRGDCDRKWCACWQRFSQRQVDERLPTIDLHLAQQRIVLVFTTRHQRVTDFHPRRTRLDPNAIAVKEIAVLCLRLDAHHGAARHGREGKGVCHGK